MSATFSQTLRSLAAERRRAPFLEIALSLALLGAWVTWFLRASVTIVETSAAARLEVDLAAHAIDAPLAGRIASSRLVIGLGVARDDVLLELDSEPEKRRLHEETTRLERIGPQIVALERALGAEEQAVANDRGATAIALEEARARQEEAQIAERQTNEEAERAAKLYDSGAIAELELLRKRSEDQRQRATTRALSLDVSQQQGNQKTRESQARARIEDMRRDLATLQGEAATTAATIERFRYEVERRTIHAPAAGRVGDAAELRPGAYVKEGDRLGSVVPTGDIHVVAEFLPAAALGRIQVGQHARIRLDAYPWIEYGVLGASVTRVASELRQGRVRVELAVDPDRASALPLEHGLPGSAEVEVEQVTPATMVVRAIGRALAHRAVSPPAPPPSRRREAAGP